MITTNKMADISRRGRLKSKRRFDALVFLSNIPLDGPGHDVIQLRNARPGKDKNRIRSEEDLGSTNNENRHDGPHQISRPHVGSEDVLVHHEAFDKLRQLEHTCITCGLHRVCGLHRRNRDEFDESIHRNSVAFQKDRSHSIQISQEKGLITLSPDRCGSSGNVRALGLERDNHRSRLLQGQMSVDHMLSHTDYDGNPVMRHLSVSCIESTQKADVSRVHLVRSMKPAQFRDGRMVLVSNHKSPFAIFSFLSYKRLRGATGRYEIESNINLGSRKYSGNHQISASDDLFAGLNSMEVGDGKTVSYCHFLVPTRERLHMQHMQLKYLGQDISTLPHSPAAKKLTSHPLKPPGLPPSPTKVVDSENIFPDNLLSGGHLYDPNVLDDPELSSGKHKKVLTFTSYMVSVIEHTKPTELKKDLNEQFADRFPHINLTLSKLRSIKKDMWKICMDCDVEPAILAQAYAYYEKLVLNGKIHKLNRKLCAGASLLLSVKLNDVKRSDLDDVIKEIEERFRVSRKELFSYEFPVLVALEFSLHLAELEILPHYKRIIQLA